MRNHARTHGRARAWGAIALVACALSARQAPAAEIDPKAAELLREAAEYIEGLKSLQVELTTVMAIDVGGMKMNMDTTHDLAIERPDKFAMIHKKGMLGGTLVTDGKTIWTHTPMLGGYSEDAAPGSLEELLSGGALAASMSPGPIMFLQMFFQPSSAEILASTSERGEYLGVEQVGGVECHHLKFSQSMLDFDIWLATGETPMPVRFAPDLGKAFTQMGGLFDAIPGGQEMLEGMSMKLSLDFDRWTADAPIPPDTFTFTPPPGARKIDGPAAGLSGLTDLLPGLGPDDPSSDERHPLEGKPAPDFTLELLDGGQVHLADHKGKNVVILDFWATWCGPCVKAMPIIEGVAREFEEQGVVLYAVNMMELPKDIRRFLDRHEIDVTVALDKKAEVGAAYLAEYIPQTVLIGKDGRIAVVYDGLLPDLRERMTGELKALVAAP